jgi:hypothetical protein
VPAKANQLGRHFQISILSIQLSRAVGQVADGRATIDIDIPHHMC